MIVRRLALFVGVWNCGVTFLFALQHSMIGMAVWMCLAVGAFSAYLYLVDEDMH